MTSSQNLWETRLFSERESAHLALFPVIAYRGKVPPSGQKRAITHPFSTWWWIEKGQVNLATQNECITVNAGHWVFIPNGLWRRQEFTPMAEIISINFIALWRENLPLIRGATLLTGAYDTVPGLTEAAARVVVAHNQPQGDPQIWIDSLPLSRRFRILAALYEFCDVFFSYAVENGASITAIPSLDLRIDWILRDLQINLRAGPLPFTRWQEQTGLSRSQLERLAKKHLNQSLHAYRDELLVTATCRALASRQPLVKQIAVQFGFVDTAHFCHWLRARTGHTPAMLQKMTGM